MTSIIDGLRAHASRLYTRNGWDFLVECWSDEDIAREIGNVRTVRGAILKVAPTLQLLDEQRRMAKAEAF